MMSTTWISVPIQVNPRRVKTVTNGLIPEVKSLVGRIDTSRRINPQYKAAIRKLTEFTALGTSRLGSCISPAAMPTISMPEKAKTTPDMTRIGPYQKNPMLKAMRTVPHVGMYGNQYCA